ncbi:MAG: class I SAM-dependent methyltransferase [Planctomycetota bacterium]
MTDSYADKSTVNEIRARFDADVERFSNLETGQVAATGSRLRMDLVSEAAVACAPGVRSVLDIGCGAGNYTLRLLQRLAERGVSAADVSVTLLDLSKPMLDRARQRVAAAGVPEARIQCLQADIRDAVLGHQAFDVALAAQCLHHLRGDDEWAAVFAKLFAGLEPAGGLWISDSVEHQSPGVRSMMHARWAASLEAQGGADYRDKVVDYVAREDTPRPLVWQLRLMESVGFTRLDVLQTEERFAAFGGAKPA